MRRGHVKLALLVLLFASAVVAQAPRKNTKGKLLIVSDIHFNAMADPSLVADLVAAEPAQWETILQESKLTKFSPYGQDSNWWLLRSALDTMARTEHHPALLMFDGDLLAHNFPRTFKSILPNSNPQEYREFVLKTVQFLALEFRQRYPDTKILLTPGNNDEDCGDYSIEANGAFLNDTAELARELAGAGAPFTESWKSLGSYSLEHPTLRDVRIVSLNTIFWSNKYRAANFANACATVNSNAPADLSAWLDAQLSAAEQSHEKVWLMFHIPPGIDGYASTHPNSNASATNAVSSCVSSIVPMWVPQWTASFEQTLTRHPATVLASFAGHTHVDSFMLAGAHSSGQFVLIDPAISPIYGRNPAFRTVNFRADGTIADQSTYNLTNLLQADSKTRGRWKREYTFSRQWKTRQLDGVSLAHLYDAITSTDQVRQLWLKLYMVSSSAAPVPAADVKGLYCAIGALDPQSYAACACTTAQPSPSAARPQPK